jgi:hypothetical protein
VIGGKKAWESLLADVLVGKPWGGSRSRGGALLPSDRKMPSRTGDYGAGWAGEGFETRACLSAGGQMYFNRNFNTGRSHAHHPIEDN